MSKYRIVYDGFRFGYRWFVVEKKFLWWWWPATSSFIGEKDAEDWIKGQIEIVDIPPREYP